MVHQTLRLIQSLCCSHCCSHSQSGHTQPPHQSNPRGWKLPSHHPHPLIFALILWLLTYPRPQHPCLSLVLPPCLTWF